MAQKAGLSRGASLVSIALLSAGCALHTPERAATRFLHDLSDGIAQSEGSAAFDKARVDLHLEERQPGRTGDLIYRRSASWIKRNERIGLVSSNVLRDPPDRFDLRLSWSPPRPLRKGLLEKLLGSPYGRSATWDSGWLIQGGILEYRATQTETPYLLFSSPGYVRDPLDFLEAVDLPHFPSLASVSRYLEQSASQRSPERLEEGGFESQAFNFPSGSSIILYSGMGPQKVPYLAGVTISLPSRHGAPANALDFIPVLRDLGIPTPDQLIAAVSGTKLFAESAGDDIGTDSFAVYNNFALALSHSPPGGSATNLTVWRRIESPRSLCEHLRPDLDRCSSSRH
jgi:hypothetical protein